MSEVSDLGHSLDLQLVELDQIKVRRMEYDYKSGLVHLDIRYESSFHYHVRYGLCDYLRRDSVAALFGATNDPALGQQIRDLSNCSHALIEYEGKLFQQADLSFCLPGALPSLVCEFS